MYKRTFMALGVASLLAMTACTSTTSAGKDADPASKRRSIDSSVDAAMSKLYAQVPGSREMVTKSKGVLVFPSVLSAGLGVGGSYGEGSLRVGNSTASYYSTAAAAVGLLAGADSKAVYVLFMTDEALAKFRESKGWTAGADANVTLLKTGANAGVDTQTMRAPVVGYALSNAGLMANVSLDGTKVTKLDL